MRLMAVMSSSTWLPVAAPTRPKPARRRSSQKSDKKVTRKEPEVAEVERKHPGLHGETGWYDPARGEIIKHHGGRNDEAGRLYGVG